MKDTLHLATGLVASASEEEIWITGLQTGKVQTRKGLARKVSAVKDIQFSPDGRFLSVLAEAGLWDSSATSVPPLALHVYSVPKLSLVFETEAVWGYSTCWSQDNKRLFWAGKLLDGGSERTVIVQVSVPSGTTRTLLERPSEETFGEMRPCGSSLLAWMIRMEATQTRQLKRRFAIVQVQPAFAEVCSPSGGAGPAWDSTGKDEILCTGMQIKEKSRVQSWRSFETQDLYRCELKLRRCAPLSVRFPEPVAVESLAISPNRRHVVVGGVIRRLQYGIMAGEVKQGAAFRAIGQRAEKYQLIGWCSDTEVLVRRDRALVVVDVNRGRERVLSRA